LILALIAPRLTILTLIIALVVPRLTILAFILALHCAEATILLLIHARPFDAIAPKQHFTRAAIHCHRYKALIIIFGRGHLLPSPRSAIRIYCAQLMLSC